MDRHLPHTVDLCVVCDLTAVRSHSTGRGRACSHRADLCSGRQSILIDTCHNEGLLCCAGSSVMRRAHWSASNMHTTQKKKQFTILGRMYVPFLFD